MGNPISCLLSSPLATKICDGLQNFAWEFGLRHAAYVYQLEDNLEALLKAADDLRVMKKMVLRKILKEKRQRMQTSEDVEQWLSRLEAATAVADRLKKEGEQAVKRLCLGGVCSTDYFSTSVFGGSVTKCLKDLQDLKVTGENLREVVVEVPAEPDSGAERTCVQTVGLDTKLQEVLCYLEEERAGIVGVYGQGGVGKTTLLKKIYNHFVRKSDCFVIWIDVPNDLNLESIQQALGEKIGLPADELTDKSLELKSECIYKQLQRKKIILLLDDIKGAVDLLKIGVPPAEGLNESRVVFTTREEQVCKQMEPQPDKSFSVETLEEELAWQLFLMKAGEDTINSHPEIPRLAKTVVKKCGGLPLALTIIGKSMSCKREPKAWERAIKTFDGPTLQHSQDREHEHAISKLFSLLRYSYDNLPSDMVRSCFSYCALYPEGTEIPKTDLVQLWTFEDFWIDIDGDDDDDEIDSHYDEANCILSILVRASLLEDKGLWVKMHDVIRSMALRISKGDALVMAGKQLKQAPKVGKWKAMKRVSLMGNEIEELAQVPECPNLVTLLLNDNTELREICPHFFQSMINLTILDLSSTKVTELPGSISRLVSLTFLDISNTKIKRLPIELTKLTKLKYLSLLNLRLTFERSEQVVRNLSSLKVLTMLCSYSYNEEGCEGEGEGANNMLSDDEMLLEELQYLEHLNVLEITIQSLSGLEKLFSTRKLLENTRRLGLGYLEGQSNIDVSFLASANRLTSFQLAWCDDMEELVVDTASNSLHILGTLTDRSFNNITVMSAYKCANLRHLTCLLLMPNLEVLIVQHCHELREIINEEKLDEVVGRGSNSQPFSNLTAIQFMDLPELESIYSIATLPFHFLHYLGVYRCPNLKKLPISSTSIMGCSQIRLVADEDWWDAIEWEDGATNDALLSRFKLRFLPKMKERESSGSMIFGDGFMGRTVYGDGYMGQPVFDAHAAYAAAYAAHAAYAAPYAAPYAAHAPYGVYMPTFNDGDPNACIIM